MSLIHRRHFYMTMRRTDNKMYGWLDMSMLTWSRGSAAVRSRWLVLAGGGVDVDAILRRGEKCLRGCGVSRRIVGRQVKRIKLLGGQS